MPVAIVLIPEEHSRVWKISSEKVPHLTLLYLGNPSWGLDQLRNVLEFVRHTAGMTQRMWAFPNDRGTLGDKDADVIFFSKRDNERMAELRDNLLGNDEIRKAHQAVNEFETWTPHLTLGYPDSPAHEVDDSSQIFSVEFTSIAVWTGNYEGVEYTFPTEDSYAEVAMTGAKAVNAYLSHYGVKGMKWGVRRGDKLSSGGGSAPKTDTSRTRYTKPPAKLSTAELKRRIQRMEMEKQYNKLNRPDMTEGQRVVTELLVNTGRRLAKGVLNVEADRVIAEYMRRR